MRWFDISWGRGKNIISTRFNTPLLAGLIYHKLGFDIPWVMGSKCHRQGFDISRVLESKYHRQGTIYHAYGEQNTISRRFNIPWVYQRVEGHNIIGWGTISRW